MSQRHQVEQRLGLLDEIRGILSGLKTLARLETQRLQPVLPIQQLGLEQVRQMASGFAAGYGQPGLSTGTPLWVVIGSERGLCGDFNQPLRQRLDQLIQQKQCEHFICVGDRLAELLQQYPQQLDAVPGAGVTDEVPDVILSVLDHCNRLSAGTPDLALLYTDGISGAIQATALLSPFMQQPPQAPAQPLLLNLAPADFLHQLLQQYLYRELLHACYSALLAENDRRVLHLENAVSHLDDQHERLQRQRNRLHQEDIINEIENILLAAEVGTDVVGRQSNPST